MYTNLKRKVLVGLLILVTSVANGQSIRELISTNHGVADGDIILADLDLNDSLDLILVGIDTLGMDVLRIYNLDTNGNLFIAKLLDIPPIKKPDIQVADLNNNGLIDIVITGEVDNNPYLNILINEYNFEFSDYTGQLPQVNGNLLLTDFTNNGFLDFIISGKQMNAIDTVMFYSNLNGLFTFCDTCKVLPLKDTRLLAIDLANNGFSDFIYSGITSNGIQKNYLYQNKNNQTFDITEVPFIITTNPIYSIGDFTQNGFMDVVIGGKINDKDSLIIYRNEGNEFEFELGLSVKDSIAKILPADFTNDGLLDLLVLTKKELILYYNNGTKGYDTTIITSLVTQSSIAIGDFDRDNDQDIFITGSSGSDNISRVFINEFPFNSTPNNPNFLYSFPLGDSVKLIWDDGTDSTTLSISLSYSAFIKGSNGYVMPVHSTTHRSLSGFGSQLLSNQLTVKNLDPGIYKWYIQAIDNSLISNSIRGNINCIWVFEIKEDNDSTQYVCKGDTLKIAIDPPQPVQWFSENEGQLSFTDTLVHVASIDDVIFANYTNDDCETRTFVVYVKILSTESIDIDNKEICQGENISFDISSKFKDANWYFKLQGDSVKGTSVVFTPQQSDSLVVEAIAESGCLMSKTVFIKVNKLPVINAGNDVLIFKGESTNLLATGGISYVWSPAIGLKNINIPNPVASPEKTVTYTVVGSNKNNCSSNDAVVVFVKESVFVPNLFSPNGDGKNDTFKIYGRNIKVASLKVFDTQGKLLFESTNTLGASNSGWDGYYEGNLMPQGDYLWIISGVFQDGSTISSNGKVSGSVTLIR